MLPRTRLLLAALMVLAAGSLRAADATSSLQKGTPDIQSAGPLAFGPDGILFVGDTRGAAIFAIDTGDRKGGESGAGIKVDGVDEKIASMLGTNAKGIMINDLAVNPASGNAYLSVSRGRGPDGTPVLIKVDRGGKLDELPLKDVKFSKAALPGVPENPKSRTQSITHIEYVQGQVIVAGLSNEEFASTLRVIPFPFTSADRGAGVRIWHTAHGKFETASPIRTFLAYDVGGEPNLLAAYTCTPLVQIPVSQLRPGTKVNGKTVAELGNRNMPLDMIVYQKGGKDYILMANSSRGVMKISTENVDKVSGLTEPVRGGGKAGLPYETIDAWKGVQQLAKLDKEHALIITRAQDGAMTLDTVELP